MKSLMRKQFLNQNWNSHDLEMTAKWWLILHKTVTEEKGSPHGPEQTVEFQLTGFPTSEGEALRFELKRLIAITSLPKSTVSLPDPDTLVLSLGAMDLDKTELLRFVLAILSGRPFDGLAVEIHFSLLNPRKFDVRSRRPSPTVLIISAQLCQNQLSIKTARRDFPDRFPKSFTSHKNSLLDEEALQAALLEFREKEKVTPQTANRLFSSKAMVYTPKWMDWLIHVPIDQPRFTALLLRALIFASAFTILGLAASLAIEHQVWVIPIVCNIIRFICNVALIGVYTYRVILGSRVSLVSSYV